MKNSSELRIEAAAPAVQENSGAARGIDDDRLEQITKFLDAVEADCYEQIDAIYDDVADLFHDWRFHRMPRSDRQVIPQLRLMRRDFNLRIHSMQKIVNRLSMLQDRCQAHKLFLSGVLAKAQAAEQAAEQAAFREGQPRAS